MAATATVTADYTVLLSTDDTGPGTWYRAYAGNPDLAVGTGPTMEDRWVPLGVPVTWYWAGAGGIEQTQPVTVDGSRGPVLSSATGSGKLHVVVVSQPPLRWEARSVAHDILYRPDPVVTVAPARYHSATLRLHLPDSAQRANLRALLARGEPLILRATCPAAVDDVTFLPTRWTEEPVSQSKKSGPRWVDIEYQAVMDNPTGYAPLPSWSWTALDAAYATWDDVEATWATWALTEQGPP
jgi:hypothetical protein